MSQIGTEAINESVVRRWKRYPAYKDSGVEWLGEIPAYWNIKRLKFFAPTSNAKLNEKSDNLPYLGLEQIESKTGRILLNTPVENVESSVSLFQEGNVLFGKLRPYLAKVACTDFQGVCTTELLVLQPSCDAYKKFLFYQLLADGFIDLVNSLTYGTKMPRVSSEQIGNLSVPVPPLSEQQAIASFLDRETAKIDTLIAKKGQLIQLLQEKRTALISHAVTKGLNPDVPMKDSGVEWLGVIPAHWEVLHLRRIVWSFVDYRGATPEKVPSGIPLITAKNIKNGVIDFSLSQEFIREEDYADWMVRGFPEVGDVLITTEAPLGESAQISSENIALAQRIILLKANKSQITNEYLKCHFTSEAGKGELWSRATGSTAIGIKASHLKETLLTVPSVSEQIAIASFLDSETAKIDALIAKIRTGVEHLKEYRTALISSAVTGKIDVCEIANAS